MSVRRMEAATKALKEVFGFPSFRPFQEKVISHVMAGKDVFVVSSTGSGKSLIFSIPALVLPGVTVVISPLLALMKDQVNKLRALGVNAARLTSDENPSTVASVLRDPSQFEIIYAAPEKVATKEFRDAFKGVKVGLIAFDEAHTVRWAREFRPAYAHIPLFSDAHPEAVRLACTATADKDVEETVVKLFKLRDFARIVSTPWRDNITWTVERDATEKSLIDLVTKYQRREGSQIVYVASRKEAETISDELENCGLSSAAYHAGQESNLRIATQDRFLSGGVKCMVATSAFGMGVDMSNIRLVANWQMPSSLFDLVQQSGRGSRDNEPAEAWVNVGGKAERTQRFLIMTGNPEYYVYERLWKHFVSKGKEPVKWTRKILLRCAGITKPVFEGGLDAALSFLEFHGGISTSGGGLTYHLPIRNPKLAYLVAKRVGASVSDGHIVYVVPQDGEDRSKELFKSGCVAPAPPEQSTLIRCLRTDNPVTEKMVRDKRHKAEASLEAIREFCWSDNKKKFIEDYFTKADP